VIELSLAKAEEKHSQKHSLADVIAAVCGHYEIKPQELSGGGRQRNLTEPRAVVAYLVRESENLSLTDLSKELQRDLSGLSQAAPRLEKRMHTDQNLSQKINKIKKLAQ